MTKGIAIHFGVDEVDPNQYPPLPPLVGVRNDARNMANIAASQQFRGLQLTSPFDLDTPKAVLGHNATRGAILGLIDMARDRLVDGDILLVTFAGHGGQRDDAILPNTEPTGRDDFWCAFDHPLIDDELFEHWAKFPAGVRILVVSDSCHSGTMTSLAEPASDLVMRGLSADATQKVVERNREHFDALRAANPQRPNVAATVMLLAACKDGETTPDGNPDGVFTKALMDVWSNGAFDGTHEELRDGIAAKVSPQSPQFSMIGATNDAFKTQKAFRI